MAKKQTDWTAPAIENLDNLRWALRHKRKPTTRKAQKTKKARARPLPTLKPATRRLPTTDDDDDDSMLSRQLF